MAEGATVLDAGCRIGPRAIAAAAAAGAARLTVRRRLRVALLATGDELAPAAVPLHGPAAIRDVNTPMLSAALARPDVVCVAAERAADCPVALRERLAALLARADLVVTTGGISVGCADLVKPAFLGLGGHIVFGGVAMKPGKPVTLGRLGNAIWLGLPGNPMSAFVTWQVFGTAILAALSGDRTPQRLRRTAVTASALHRRPGRCELRPCLVAGRDGLGREVLRFDDATHSARVATLPAADGLMILPAETDHLPAGALVDFLPFPTA